MKQSTTASIFNTNPSSSGSVKIQVMKALGWDIETYASFQYETGLEYLKQYVPEDEEGRAMLERSRIFWNWWKNHWMQRDVEFLKQLQSGAGPLRNQMIYGRKHSVRRLISKIYPSAVILENDYSVMIGKVNDHLNLTK